jgi:D-alanyl-D-alanine carboxypeptidase
VYRLRRAGAASGIVLVLYLLYQLVGGGGGGDETATTTSSSTTTTLPAIPVCTDKTEYVVQENPRDAWATIAVDTERSLPPSYGPPDLTNISEAGFPFTPGVALRGFVMDDLARMRAAAEAAGAPLTIIAAYRSFPTQVDLFDRRVGELGATEAGSRVARPGHSEHQLGTTIDVTSAGLTDVDQSWGASATGQWIASNAHKYGFILSYPADAQERTCYDYEPWHLRYVGPDQAAQVVASGLTLREYLFSLGVNVIQAGTPTTTTTVETEG